MTSADAVASGDSGEEKLGGLALHDQVSSLRGLLALSILMMERRSEREVLQVAATAVPGLAGCRTVGVHLERGGWEATSLDARARAELEGQLARLGPAAGPVAVSDAGWAWALQLRDLGEFNGHLVVASASEPSAFDLVLLRSLAQQTGIALANARLHATTRAANDELAETVASLRRKTAIHDRFTQVALRGEGRDGIVVALHELTGLGAGIADRSGTLVAWAGREGARPESLGQRLVEQALRVGRPVRADGCLAMVARPRADVVGVLFVVDPDGRSGEAESVALEHGTTVLAIELARLLSLAETELRLGVDVVADLVGGTDIAGASRRASALGHDLSRPHRVVVLGTRRARHEPDALVRAVRSALGGERQPLLMQRGDTLVMLFEVASRGDRSFVEALASGVRTAPGGRFFRIGIGGMCEGAEGYPRSYREAQLALRLPDVGASRGTAVVYDDLGVYQLLSEVSDLSGVDAFARRWLGVLIDYDERKQANLVGTLASYLDLGGNYDATASFLGVGRSTVRYRLARIRELTGLDLSVPDVRFQLQLACKAWFTRRALSGE